MVPSWFHENTGTLFFTILFVAIYYIMRIVVISRELKRYCLFIFANFVQKIQLKAIAVTRREHGTFSVFFFFAYIKGRVIKIWWNFWENIKYNCFLILQIFEIFWVEYWTRSNLCIFRKFYLTKQIKQNYFHSEILFTFKKLFPFKNLTFIQKTSFHSKTLFLFNNCSVCICRDHGTVTWLQDLHHKTSTI